MELCSGKDLEVIQLHFPTKTKTIISQSCIPDHSSLWILKVELIYFPHSLCMWVYIGISLGLKIQIFMQIEHMTKSIYIYKRIHFIAKRVTRPPNTKYLVLLLNYLFSSNKLHHFVHSRHFKCSIEFRETYCRSSFNTTKWHSYKN